VRPLLRLKSPPKATFCVWRTDSSRVKRSHETYESALAEAERLAEANPGKRFIVLRSVRAVRKLALTP